jgi:enoyl-[acyl-carrier protein] reductase / trans-2-enoyl-CoA reductase (NAD+)
MPEQVVTMRARGFICTNAHPEGCGRNVADQVDAAKKQARAALGGVRNALIIGSSTGYGLASRVAVAWGYQARTLGVFFERPPEADRTATAGWYNTVALDRLAKRDRLFAAHLNGDAFSDEVKREAIAVIRQEMGPLDLVIYSLASPRRTHPRTGEVHNSTLKPIGAPYSSRTIDLGSRKVVDITIAPASEKEIADTVAVMGGEDWEMWMRLLDAEGLLAQGARTLAYSYIGPSVTWPVYRDGTIGRAKEHLEQTARMVDGWLAHKYGGHAWVAVNKAVVTQASAAIPVVPLYLSLLFRVMGAKNIDEDTAAQMRRLFFEILPAGKVPLLDAARRVRVDDREMRPDVQAEVAALWPLVNTENLLELSGYRNFERGFRNLFGFEVEGVDYARPVETDLHW